MLESGINKGVLRFVRRYWRKHAKNTIFKINRNKYFGRPVETAWRKLGRLFSYSLTLRRGAGPGRKHLLSASLCFAILWSGSVFPATFVLYVDDGGGNVAPYATIPNAATTIQTAWDHIATLNGSVDLVAAGNDAIIYVVAGTYGGALNLDGYTTGAGNAIFLRNNPGDQPVILNQLVALKDPFTTFQGFLVDGGGGGSAARGIDSDENFVIIRSNEVINVTTSGGTTFGIQLDSGSVEGAIVAANIVHNNRSGIRLVSQRATIVSNIIFRNDTGSDGQGIRFGQGGASNRITQNIIYSNGSDGIQCRAPASGDIIFNNLVFDNVEHGFSTRTGAGSLNGARVFNNTFHRNGLSGVEIDEGGAALNLIAVFNNISTSNAEYGFAENGGPTYAMGGAAYNNSFGNTLGIENNLGAAWLANNFSLDPHYVSTTIGDKDHLKVHPNSPVIDAGMDPNAYWPLPIDFWEDPRPSDVPGMPNTVTAYDVGADEYYSEMNPSKSATYSISGVSVGAIQPGYTISYAILITNPRHQNPISNAVYRDAVPWALEYKAGSTVNAGSFTGEWSALSAPNQNYSSGDYSGANNITARWVRWRSGYFATAETGILGWSGVMTNLYPAGAILSNIVSSTGNYSTSSNFLHTVTVGTMVGGALNYAPPDKVNTSGIATIWTMRITNKGNIQTTFNLGHSVCGLGSSVVGDWSFSFSTASINLDIGEVGSFTVDVTPVGAGNSAWIDFDIVADTGTIATNYDGDDGRPYAGDIGATNDGTVKTSMWGKVVQQGNTADGNCLRLTRIFSGSLASVKIRKLSNPDPVAAGSPITYTVIVTNEDPANDATGVRVRDLIPMWAQYVAGSMKEGAYGSTYGSANPLSDGINDDEGYYDGTQVEFTIVGGTSPAAGGTLSAGTAHKVYFQVTPNAGNPSGSINTNVMNLNIIHISTGQTRSSYIKCGR